MNCEHCHKPVDPDSPLVGQKIEGWEFKEKGGSRRGGSDIVARRRLEVFACYECVMKLKRGISPNQGTL